MSIRLDHTRLTDKESLGDGAHVAIEDGFQTVIYTTCTEQVIYLDDAAEDRLFNYLLEQRGE